MRVVVIGGTGHIGSYLTPRLVEAGHAVTSVSRGRRRPYFEHAAWGRVRQVELDRVAEEAGGTFGERIAALGPQVVIDLTCYMPSSAQQLAVALRSRVEHLLHCGTIWVHGHSVEVPTTEEAARTPFGDYGIRKAEIERYLLDEAHRNALPVTILHPGHLVGTGWNPVNPQGNFNPRIFSDIARGGEVHLPNLGMETLHHVHADDVASAFVAAMENRGRAIGESFHVVSASAITLRGFAERMAMWFRHPPRLTFLPWPEWRALADAKDAEATWDHIAHSPNCSIAKARRLLGFEPRYSSLAAVQQAVAAMREAGTI